MKSVDEQALNEELGVFSRIHRDTILAQIEKLKALETAALLRKHKKYKLKIIGFSSLFLISSVLLAIYSSSSSYTISDESKLIKDPRLVYKTETYGKYTGNYNIIYIYIYIYIGQFLGEKRHGYGVYEWKNGSRYEGTRFGLLLFIIII